MSFTKINSTKNNTKQEEIINKIIQLRKKTKENGCSQAEIDNALSLIDKLVTKYNISLSDIEVNESVYDKLISYESSSIKPYIKKIYQTVAKLFFCKIVLKEFIINGKKKEKIEIFGEKVDVVLCHYTVELIINNAKEMFKSFKTSEDYAILIYSKVTNYTIESSYFLGIYTKINSKIEDIITERNNKLIDTQNMALIVLKDKLVKKAFDENYTNIIKQKQVPLSIYSLAYDKGINDADNINITKGLDN